MQKASRWTLIVVVLLLIGFAGGFSTGRHAGFETGSEWALVQADILAREAGVFMPVYLEDGEFRVIIKQPRNLYKRAWKLADRSEEAMEELKIADLEKLEDQSTARQTNF